MAEDVAHRTVSAAYVLNADVLEKYRREFPARNGLYTLIFGIGLIVFAFLSCNPFDITHTKLVMIGLFLMLIYPLSAWVQPARIRQFRRWPGHINYGFVFDENGCRLSKNGAEKAFAWSQISRIQQTTEYFLIWRKGHKHFRWLPRSAFASDADIETFLRYVEQAKVKLSKGSVDGSLIFTLFSARPPL